MQGQDRWIIVGGGASGLAAAFFLERLGIDCEIIERGNAVGGRIGSIELGGRSLDCGGKNIGRRYTLFRQFAASLGNHPFEYFGLNSSQLIDGRIRTFEASSRWRTMVEMTRGVPARDIVRFGRLLWRVRHGGQAGYLGSRYSRALGRRYDAAPASRYFSPEFCRRIVRPMSVRMNAAEPDEVYVGNLPSNVRMLLDTYEQFEHGLAPVLGAFVARYTVRLGTTAEGLLVSGGRVTGVRVRHPDGTTTELHGAGVVLATPAGAAATLVDPILPGLARRLRTVAYYPVSLVIAEYDRPIFSAAARAFVFDAREVVSNAGAYGVNDLHIVRYTFSGRSYRRYSSRHDGEALLRLGEAALSRHVPLDRCRRQQFVARHFDPGLCAYTPYHGRFLDDIVQQLSTVPGLHVTGDYVQGASIEACFRSASACVRGLATEAERVMGHAGVGQSPTRSSTWRGGALRHHCTNSGDFR